MSNQPAWITEAVKPKAFERVEVRIPNGDTRVGYWRDYTAWSCWEVEGEVSTTVVAWRPIIPVEIAVNV